MHAASGTRVMWTRWLMSAGLCNRGHHGDWMLLRVRDLRSVGPDGNGTAVAAIACSCYMT
jgi:hypothetical protein